MWLCFCSEEKINLPFTAAVSVHFLFPERSLDLCLTAITSTFSWWDVMIRLLHPSGVYLMDQLQSRPVDFLIGSFWKKIFPAFTDRNANIINLKSFILLVFNLLLSSCLQLYPFCSLFPLSYCCFWLQRLFQEKSLRNFLHSTWTADKQIKQLARDRTLVAFSS